MGAKDDDDDDDGEQKIKLKPNEACDDENLTFIRRLMKFSFGWGGGTFLEFLQNLVKATLSQGGKKNYSHT